MRGFKPIGKCIYCDSTAGLSKEHIYTKAMGGGMTLGQASCEHHRDVTSEFERLVAREMYGDLRATEGYPTDGERPQTLPAQFVDQAGNPRLAELLISDYPTNYPAIEFLDRPGIVEGRPPIGGNPALSIHPRVNTDGVKRALAAAGADTIKIRQTILLGPYCQLLCKTAHALACAVLGTKGWRPLLIPLIEGTSDEFAHYLGAAPPPGEGEVLGGLSLHWILIGPSDQGFSVTIRALGRLDIPATEVVVGEITHQGVVFGESAARGYKKPPPGWVTTARGQGGRHS
jgi:hypothetical protein